ncbi:MAG: VanZ family protein [Burkholderiaceae bacterium]|nr:VanZ family protein [Burkholderiaceae bacterium]MCX7901340.1 VanZ family protein [Burkholderiaceae bacterium]
MPADRFVVRAARRRGSPLARLACAAYALLIVYASLAPWSGWRDLGVGPFAFLWAPWPEYVTHFDVAVNVLGYLPFGALLVLALYPRLRGGAAVAVALATGALLSGAIEALQTYLPPRIASNVDWLANVGGTAFGALLGAWRADSLIDRGRLQQLRAAWFTRDGSVALVLLALWPLAQMHPLPMLFGLGAADGALLEAARRWFVWLPARMAWTSTEFILAEALVTTAGLLAAGLMAASVMTARAPRLALLAALGLAALGAKALAYGVRFGSEHALAWLTPGAVAGLLLGTLALSVAAWGPPRAVARLGLLACVTLLVAVAVIPQNPYFTAWLMQWRSGRLAHFHAATQWLASAWPFAAAAWLAAREFMRRDGTCAYNEA